MQPAQGFRLRTTLAVMRVLAVGFAIAIIVFVLSGGSFFFLPLLFVPFGVFRSSRRRRGRNDLALSRGPLVLVQGRSRKRRRRRF